jgi:DNA helicase-2/ATP-dependent DNA helicase PcrA
LRRYAPKVGYENNFLIMDQDDSESLIGRLRADDFESRDNPKFPKRGTIQNIFSQTVNKDTNLSSLLKKSYKHLLYFERALARIFNAYATYKIKNNMMDFDDLLVRMEQLLAENESSRQEIASRFNFILVDEYQDTNAIQARLTALLGQGHQNVTAVGDEAQSIYSFRGANFHNIMNFPGIFPGTKIVKLEDNYRSHPQILSVANHLLTQAKERFEKTLRPTRPDGPLARIIHLDTPADEAKEVARQIEADLSSGLSLNDMAVLFRASSHSFELEKLLNARRIPYTKFGGRKFLELAHIKDFICYLRISANPQDKGSLRRVLGHVSGLGPKGIENVIAWSERHPDYYAWLAEAPFTSAKAKQNSKGLGEHLASICQAGLAPEEVVDQTLTFYSKILPDLYPDDYPDRLADIQEFKGMASSHETLTDLLADLALDPPNNLAVTHEEAKARGDLTLSTIHSAKGLEWPRVYLISAVEGRFPSAYAKGPDIEEELRLMYVAVTRARDRLVITMPQFIAQWSQGGESGPSRFLGSLRAGQVEIIKDGKLLSSGSVKPVFERLEEVISLGYAGPKKPIDNPRAGRGQAHSQGPEPGDGDTHEPWADNDCQDAWEDNGSQELEWQSQDSQHGAYDKPPMAIAGATRPVSPQGAYDRPPKSIAGGLKAVWRPTANSPETDDSPEFAAVLEEPIDNPLPGQRVRHPFFRVGSVVTAIGDMVIIDFDEFGKRKVKIKHAKLTSAND